MCWETLCRQAMLLGVKPGIAASVRVPVLYCKGRSYVFTSWGLDVSKNLEYISWSSWKSLIGGKYTASSVLERALQRLME